MLITPPDGNERKGRELDSLSEWLMKSGGSFQIACSRVWKRNKNKCYGFWNVLQTIFIEFPLGFFFSLFSFFSSACHLKFAIEFHYFDSLKWNKPVFGPERWRVLSCGLKYVGQSGKALITSWAGKIFHATEMKLPFIIFVVEIDLFTFLSMVITKINKFLRCYFVKRVAMVNFRWIYVSHSHNSSFSACIHMLSV